ncbi:putative RNA-binding Zn-ribbon protein involved in translation (DUF1610 family) [Virgibacillus natechei]|uniref:RNA-binding Zn-ribbon protein involved in translation (DUF1610 family) n=1 Tax=Virgibacillus natechei TaxID=1216297 RepID=A0ABS4IGE6_9BACI|nr:DUF4145 domain-containing protein [Virgibacillus natechei]MBP1970022.1 putative RNA-binding Zn-ribbon protein involved in translation (DUF1610 family) [Virgibacillus natechei]UZD13323.1 DUF4145 domain-containing protein [Virgibacillus natechei]
MSEKVVLTCPHCGNKTLMKTLNSYVKGTETPMGYDELFQATDTFEVFECPVCEGFHLFHTHMNSEDYHHYPADYDPYEDGEVLYPASEKVKLNGLPSSIKSAYESALKVQNIDDTVCTIALRRTLEMVCKDKGAVRGSLYDKLNELQEQGILPPLMGDISKVIKDFGNMAAHGDPVTFNKYMVESMFRFTNKILEYIYIFSPKK